MLGGSWSRSIEEARQLLGCGCGRGAGRSPIGGGVALSKWRVAVFLGVVIAIEYLADAFGTPGVGLPVVEHPRPASEVSDSLSDRGALPLGRCFTKGCAVGGDGGVFGTGW
jgi:hypothetical protein